MLVDINSDRPQFSVGDLVVHPTWNTGRITEITKEPEVRIFIEFSNGFRHDMSMEMATKALTRPALNGLTAQVILNPGIVKEWEHSAPFKLIAAALVDLGKPSKPREIQGKIENLLTTKWENWWKKVQPALKKSSYFKALKNGTYELLVNLDQIPSEPLPAQEKKREIRLTKTQTLALAKEVQAGLVVFDNTGGALTKKKIAVELIRQLSDDPQSHDVIDLIIRGQARSAGILLDEIARKGNAAIAGFSLDALIKYNIELSISALSTNAKGIEEHFNAELNLLRDFLKYSLSRQIIEPSDMTQAAQTLTKLALTLQTHENLVWQIKATDTLVHSLSTLALVEPMTIPEVGTVLGNAHHIEPSVEIATRLISTLIPGQRNSIMVKIIAAAMPCSPEFADNLIRKLRPKDDQLRWWIENVHLFYSQNANSSISTILEMLGNRINAIERDEYIALLANILMISPSIVLPAVTKEIVASWGRNIDLTSPESKGDGIEKLFAIVIQSQLVKQVNDWNKTKEKLESRVIEMQNANNLLAETVGRLESQLSELKANFHLPEKLVEYRSKREILERLGKLFQELFETNDKNNNSTTRWALNQIETILILNKATMFGNVGLQVRFDPSQHELVQSLANGNNLLKIVTPGFTYKDPAGNETILVRARVSDR